MAKKPTKKMPMDKMPKGKKTGSKVNNDACCSEAKSPYCKPQPRDITDTEKASYLKLVALATAGKIVWTSECNGGYSGYDVWVGDGSVTLNKTGLGNTWHTVANFSVKGRQIAGDLSAIAVEQYATTIAQLTAEFLQA